MDVIHEKIYEYTLCLHPFLTHYNKCACVCVRNRLAKNMITSNYCVL